MSMGIVPLHRKGGATLGFQRLNLSEAVASADPGSRLSSPITDGGNGVGLQIALTGSWTSTDWAGAWPYLVWPLKDHKGVQITSDDLFDAICVLRIRTHPGDSTDTDLRIAVVNETDLTTGTIDGVAGGIRWTAAARNGVVANVTNGAAGGILAGTGVAGAEYAQVNILRQGAGAGTVVVIPRVCLLDSSKALIASSNVNAAPSNGIPIGTGALYLALVVGRSAATAGAVTLAVDAYVNRPPSGLQIPA